ncbi:MAG TPA: hypothetical protein VNL94_09985 [Candidatus Binatia bacterium]|nr:hypothetical protein [Candidatus Binatia bacterium]
MTTRTTPLEATPPYRGRPGRPDDATAPATDVAIGATARPGDNGWTLLVGLRRLLAGIVVVSPTRPAREVERD